MAMSLTTRVRRTIDMFVDAEVDGELAFMDVGEGRFYSLKETGIHTWNLIDEVGAWTTVSALTKALCEEFKVDEEAYQRDVGVLLDEMAAADLIKLASHDPDAAETADWTSPRVSLTLLLCRFRRAKRQVASISGARGPVLLFPLWEHQPLLPRTSPPSLAGGQSSPAPVSTPFDLSTGSRHRKFRDQAQRTGPRAGVALRVKNEGPRPSPQSARSCPPKGVGIAHPLIF